MLPIGSVVYLKDGQQKLMILNRGPIIDVNNVQKYVDYSACEFPTGLIPEQVYYFNEEDIDQVIFEGLRDGDEARFEALFKAWRTDNASKVPQARIVKDSTGDIVLQ